MKRYYYLIVLSIFSLWGCHQPEDNNIVPPKIEKEPVCVDIALTVDTAVNEATYEYTDLLGRGFDCKQSIIKGYANVKSRIIDVKHFQSQNGHIQKALFYQSGDFITNGNKDLKKYIDNIYSNSNVETKIGSHVLDLFTEDIGINKENIQSNEFYKVEFIKPTGRMTLSDIYPNFLYKYLSEEFINDLNKCNSIDIIKKYGTHVLTDVLLGGYMSISYTTQYEDDQYDIEFGKQAKYYADKVFSSYYPVDITRIFEGANKVKIHVKTIGGIQSLISRDDNNKVLGFREWSKSIDFQSGKLIGVGQNTTHLYLISDFVQDTKKKGDIEKAIMEYCNQ